MSESFDNFELGDVAGGSQEVTKEQQEQFRDAYKKTQAAIKKIRKQEKKKKQQDDTLAHVIVQFLNDPRFTQFFVLIAKIFAKNVSSDLILAILSLIHHDSAKVIEEKELDIPERNMSDASSGMFPPKTKAQIQRWTQNITGVAAVHPHKSLETMLDQNWELDPNIVQLTVSVAQQFFVFQRIDVPPVGNLQNFFQGFYTKLIEILESQVHEQAALSGEVDADFTEENE